ncbi:hypothetical protein ACHFCA_38230 (plasmid) [Delftia tsuruhatensis]|jgi:adenylate kinase family enzyme
MIQQLARKPVPDSTPEVHNNRAHDEQGKNEPFHDMISKEENFCTVQAMACVLPQYDGLVLSDARTKKGAPLRCAFPAG